MYSQIISAQSLFAVMTQKEHRNYCHGKDKETMLVEIQKVCVDKIYDGSYHFNLTFNEEFCTNAHPSGSIEYLCQDLLIRKLSVNILRSYRLKPTNRKLVISQIKQLLDTETHLCIIRKDVRHFFESVDPNIVLLNMRKDGRVTLQTIQLCDMLMQCAAKLGVRGVPIGLSISSALSELLMHRFDYTFTKLPDTLLYSRYVDDIIMISTRNCDIEAVQKLVDESLCAIGLEENEDKRCTLTCEDWNKGVEFEYLGYSFVRNGKRVKISISEKKLKKIKTRITLAFKDFVKTGDERMLFDRMQFLSCVSCVSSSSLNLVRVGLPANYSATTDSDSFKIIDIYYMNILHCKNGSFGHDLQTKLSALYKDKLNRISFVHCYEHRIRRKFSVTRIHDLNRCWL